MTRPTVAIVGRPNVGKSTLFNRLLGGRDAIVSEHAGTTRDRHFGDCEWNGRHFWLIDTGGLVPGSSESMDVAVRRQVELAVEQADLVVLVVDGKEGPNPVDREIAAQLRQTGRPVLVAVNKLDDLPHTTGHLPFYELGLGDPLPFSALIGKASGDLLDAIVARLPDRPAREDQDAIQVAVVGRPNAGKSSLVNRLLGEERLLVAPEPGTTRDAIDTPLRYHGKVLNFIDTAGLRRSAKVEDDIEFYSTLRTHRAIEAADVCVLVVDAALGLHAQDLRIATEAWEKGAGLIVAVTKWDLIQEKDANTARRGQMILADKAPFLRDVPFLYVSAVTGQRVARLPELIVQVAEARERRIPTAEVNRVLQELVARNAPPQQPGEEVKLLYAAQVGIRPPTFAIVCNRPDDVPEAYRRYLIHGFRAAWGFEGAPLRLKFTSRGAGRHRRRDDGRRVRGRGRGRGRGGDSQGHD
ncbi:MAG TPA: ribosome biogenesis GTPase Der [Gemmatimonadales bacterium]|nr:ribosome biogenesis GTPase Der [Gemmatimonadales bacterium]